MGYERQQRERQRHEYEDNRYPNYRQLIEQRERNEQRYREQNRETGYRYEKRINERELGAEYSRERTRRYDERENEEHQRNQEPEGKRLKDLNGDYSICYYHAKNETTYTKTVCRKGEESCKYKHPIICKNTNC